MAPPLTPASSIREEPMSDAPIPSPCSSYSKDDTLRIGIDLGTSRTRVFYQHLHGPYTQITAPIKPVKLKKNQDAAAYQIMVLNGDGSVIYGWNDVNEAILNDPSLQDKAIRRMKLALHEEFENIPDVVHTRKVLNVGKDRGALQDSFEMFLLAVIEDTKAFLKRQVSGAGEPGSYWDNITLEFQISVPAMWNDAQRGIVRNAAQMAARSSATSAKSLRIELREEALCVATPYMNEMGPAEVGSLLITVDDGDGTLDIATTELSRAHSHTGAMQLRRVGLCSGNGAGAHMVNAEAAKWLLQYSNIKGMCGKLHISERELLRQFNDAIDYIKEKRVGKRLKGREGSIETVTIESSHGKTGHGYLNEKQFAIPYELIMSWYKMWIDTAAKLLKSHLASLPAARRTRAILTGGGANSTQFCERMEAILAEHNIDCESDPKADACGTGTLMQHYFQEGTLPLVANFYLTEDKCYDEDLHLEATDSGSDMYDDTQEEEHIGRGETRNEETLRIKPTENGRTSKWDPEEVVLSERVRKIGTYRNGTFSSMKPIPMEFHVKVDAKLLDRLHVDLYWSKRNLAEHSSLRDDAGNWFPEIRRYPMVFADLDDLASHGFEIHGGDDEVAPHFIVYAFVEMTGSSDELFLSIHVMKPDYQFLHESDDSTPIYGEEHVLFTHTRKKSGARVAVTLPAKPPVLRAQAATTQQSPRASYRRESARDKAVSLSSGRRCSRVHHIQAV